MASFLAGFLAVLEAGFTYPTPGLYTDPALGLAGLATNAGFLILALAAVPTGLTGPSLDLLASSPGVLAGPSLDLLASSPGVLTGPSLDFAGLLNFDLGVDMVSCVWGYLMSGQREIRRESELR